MGGVAQAGNTECVGRKQLGRPPLLRGPLGPRDGLGMSRSSNSNDDNESNGDMRVAHVKTSCKAPVGSWLLLGPGHHRSQCTRSLD